MGTSVSTSRPLCRAMGDAKRRKTGDSDGTIVPEGRGLLCISLDSQTVDAALESMRGVFSTPAFVYAAPVSATLMPMQVKRWRRSAWT